MNKIAVFVPIQYKVGRTSFFVQKQVSKRMDTKKVRVVDVPGGDHSLGTKTAAGEKR